MPHYVVFAVAHNGALLVKGFEEHELVGARTYCNILEQRRIYSEICLFLQDFDGDYRLLRRYI